MKTLQEKRNEMSPAEMRRVIGPGRSGPMIKRIEFLEEHIASLEEEIIELKKIHGAS